LVIDKLPAITIFLALITSVPAISYDETSEIVVHQVNGIFEGLLNSTPSIPVNGTFKISVNSSNINQKNIIFADSLQSILNLSALILAIVNGLILLRNYLRDKPKLEVKPLEPDTQWFFVLPSGEHQVSQQESMVS
jgi:hypothetical protein